MQLGYLKHMILLLCHFQGQENWLSLLSRIFKFLVRADETDTDAILLEEQLFDILSLLSCFHLENYDNVLDVAESLKR